MFNDLFFLQFILVFFIILLFFISDIFFFLLNTLLILILITILSWFLDFDIFINFLIIIDLGLFFIFLAYILNFLNLFSKITDIFFKKNIFIFIFIFIFLIYILLNQKFQLNFYSSYLVYLTINFFNWYSIFHLFIFSDLQLLAEFYFNFNLIFFIIMNFYIYTSILIVYYIIVINNLFSNIHLLHLFSKFIFKYKNDAFFFLKTQNFNKQRMSKLNVRVWSKKKYNSII